MRTNTTSKKDKKAKEVNINRVMSHDLKVGDKIVEEFREGENGGYIVKRSFEVTKVTMGKMMQACKGVHINDKYCYDVNILVLVVGSEM